MITLTRLNGAAFALNDLMVERVEANPDTVVVLTDGKKFIVAESVDEVIEQIRQARADVAIRSSMIEIVEDPGPDLRLIQGSSDSKTDNEGDVTDDVAGNEVEGGGTADDHTSNELTAKEGGSWIQ